MTKALAMVSGGLDSILAAKLIKDQGIEVIGICFKSYFFSEESAKRMTKQIDIPLEVIDFSKEHMKMVRDPKHGWGKNMNPCIDCHAMMMKYSGELLEKFNADFIITGEVLNQRPMSQNRQALNTVKKASGFANKILRPLCAKNLDETEMETNGLVDREKLLDIMGRSRKPQMALAEEWGITEYPSPAGGCRLTEPNYAIRLKEMLSFKENSEENLDENEIELLRFGRHFRLAGKTKVIAARTGDEGIKIKEYINNKYIAFYASNFTGALVVLTGEGTDKDIEIAARITARYSKGRNEEMVEVKYGQYGKKFTSEVTVKPINDEELQTFIIGAK
ncbi:tRNA 4-thiouridine(8) synthase ThiI [Clostridium gasigenes]|uniref:tRNA 4-thiouridine(8) synthase ThiI n=1 Tax=Clostridium gasigenes TaxID=94869 RepID=UPI001C0DF8C5|nr:tRNA 4-thiouridine(8) synthase ThiI [Clostridium gasigenes]MBU3103881.1 tRNA 4-thiouridine(8) synthase ThiI [Clostridium gasigenes]MBU3136547.1 tRNA 4-thiouridine(8) synthase ThiI [Clostridium gasigenes]